MQFNWMPNIRLVAGALAKPVLPGPQGGAGYRPWGGGPVGLNGMHAGGTPIGKGDNLVDGDTLQLRVQAGDDDIATLEPGMALISDGVWRPVHFSIIEDSGMIGASWGVEWCVAGIDRNWAYNPSCKMAQP